MTRWIHTLALLVVAIMVANAQCHATCLVPAFQSIEGQHSSCCPTHSSAPKQSPSGCQHGHSELTNAELNSDLWQAAAPSSPMDFVTGDPAAVFSVDAAARLFSRFAGVPDIPPQDNLFVKLSVLRV